MDKTLNAIYASMKDKCCNSKSRYYKNYGGRGITICGEWLNKKRTYKGSLGWLAFQEWAYLNGYKKGLTLDRINNEEGYSPQNCRWVSMKLQSCNIRYIQFVTYKGKTQSLSEWCRELHLRKSAISKRLNKCNWSVERAFTEPVGKPKKRKNTIIRSFRLRKTFTDMKARCYNSNRKDYRWYGGKGIKVCDEWLCTEKVHGIIKGFVVFQEWAFNHGYKDGLTIDRIDSSKDYSPDNCRWITIEEQQNNKSSNHWITYKGKTQTLLQWSRELKMYHGTIRHRLCNLHWSVEKAFETPVNPNRKSKLRREEQ